MVITPYWKDRFGFTDYPCVPPRFERRMPFPWRRVELLDFHVKADAFPVFVDEDGSEWTCDKHFFSDGGSIPLSVQSMTGITADRFKPAFYFHDAAYRHGGLWKWVGDRWIFMPLTRDECDRLLYRMILASGGYVWEAELVYRGLKWFGGFAWSHHEELRKQEDAKRRDR